MPDLVSLMLEIAYASFKAGEITKDELMGTIKRCINLRAVENGYDKVYGKPYPGTG